MTALEFISSIARGVIPDVPNAESNIASLISVGMLEREDDGRVVLTEAGWHVVERAA